MWQMGACMAKGGCMAKGARVAKGGMHGEGEPVWPGGVLGRGVWQAVCMVKGA